MQSQTPIKQYVRLYKVEQPGAWLFVAVLMEDREGEAIAISEPRILKIVSRAQEFILKGAVKTANPFILSGTAYISRAAVTPLVSPYVFLFGYKDAGILNHLGARPPTV